MRFEISYTENDLVFDTVKDNTVEGWLIDGRYYEKGGAIMIQNIICKVLDYKNGTVYILSNEKITV